MSDAKNNQHSRGNREFHTSDVPVPQRKSVEEGERGADSLVDIAGDLTHEASYMEALAFNEEPVTVQIHTVTGGSKYPETHVPVQVNGRGAEVLYEGKWLAMGWLPIGIELTIKRKYVEVLARSRPEDIETKHDESNVEKPRNWQDRKQTQKYPMTIIKDTQKGHEWLSRLLYNHA